MHIRLLQFIGLRTDCCGAKIIAWHHDKHYCAKCENWLYLTPRKRTKIIPTTEKPIPAQAKLA